LHPVRKIGFLVVRELITMGTFGGSMERVIKVVFAVAVLTVLTLAQGRPEAKKAQESTMSNTEARATVADAEKFMAETEVTLSELSVKLARAQWVQATFITDDTERFPPTITSA
jgi:hypothetical protein